MIQNAENALDTTVIIPAKRIYLRRFHAEDIPAVYEMASDEEVVRYLIWEGVQTQEEAKLFVEQVYMQSGGYFAVALRENDVCIGSVHLHLALNDEKAAIGYMYDKKYWGQGYATEALHAIIDFCFTKLELNRIECDHFTENPASGNIMRKCGMQFEGIMREKLKVKGRFIDFAHYAILHSDWLAYKQEHLFSY